jgi:hypothetical protein
MNPRHLGAFILATITTLTGPFAGTATADWHRTDSSIAWHVGSEVVWKYTFDPTSGKPYFDPVAPVGGARLTNFKPEDHPWHYGLWFSWKYINGANYWEEDRTGRSAGLTTWKAPSIETTANGRATIAMDVAYTHPSGRVDLTETRRLVISAPDADGGYTIDWHSRFVAGADGAVLDRTPMPGEPRGAVNGGYAGLGARLASPPLAMTVVTTDGPITEYVSDRARPNAPAVGATFTENGRVVGAIAILSDPANIGERAPWYIINNNTMRFLDPAILAPAVRTLKPGEAWTLAYRITVRRSAWTPELLRAALAAWTR